MKFAIRLFGMSICLLGCLWGQGAFLQPGMAVVVSSVADTITVVNPGGGSPAHVPVALGQAVGFSSESPDCVVWDPLNPDDVIIGGERNGGYLLRISFATGGTSATVAVIVAPGGLLQKPTQISWDQNGQLVVIDPVAQRVFRVDVNTSAITTLTPSLSPFGGLSCGMVDHRTGDILVGTSNAKILRIIPGGAGIPAVVTEIYSFPASTSPILDLSVDPLTPDRVSFIPSSPKLPHRYEVSTGVMTPFLSGPMVGVSLLSLRVDEIGTYLAAGGTNGPLWRLDNPLIIPASGTSFIPMGNALTGNQGLRDTAVVGATLNPVRMEALALPGGAGVLAWVGFPAIVSEGYTLVSTSTWLPRGTGPLFGILPDLLTFQLLGASALASPGNPLHFAGTPPAVLSFPAGSFSPFAGQSWDFVAIGFNAAGQFVAKSNVARATWQ